MNRVLAALVALPVLLAAATANAQLTGAGTLDPTCAALFNLSAGTITTAASAVYLNPQTCAAYQYLIGLYDPGNCSTVGIPNAKVQGITDLNSDFAKRLAGMLQAASAAGYQITINSAYRTIQGEICANKTGFGGNPSLSMHTKGLAADLQFPGDPNSATSCDSGSQGSPARQWILANDKTYGIGLYDQLHAHGNGECNHVEASTPVQGGSLTTPGAGLPYGLQTLNPSACVISVNPLAIAQPNTVPQSQCITTGAGQTPPPPPPPPPPQMTTPSTGGSAPTPTQSSPQVPVQTQSQTPPPIGTVNSTAYAPGTCNPQTYCSQTDGNIYYRSTQCVDQLYEQCPSGCSGLVCNAASSTASAAASPLSDLFNAPLSAALSQSPSDAGNASSDLSALIASYAAAPAQTVDIATATQIALNAGAQNTDNAAVLVPAPEPSPIAAPTSSATAATVHTLVAPQAVETFTAQTYTSGNLASSTPPSALDIALSAVRDTILHLLSYLQLAPQTSSNGN